MTERALATVRKIDAINPIDGADMIEVATVGGWKVVVKKGEFEVGQLAVYLEIDSWVPNDLAPFLSKGQEPREYNGVRGERLRTVKLRKQISQGLILPVHKDFTGTYLMIFDEDHGEYSVTVKEDDDVTEVLNIQKWEAPVSAGMQGKMRGNFPSFIPKTDQERIQNLKKELPGYENLTWEITEKLDGSSMTVYLREDYFGVCSRNIDLIEVEGNSFWDAARENKFEEKIRQLGRNLALQGELVGEGIQDNKYGLKGRHFYLFDVYDIDNGVYFNGADREMLAKALLINHTPLVGYRDLVDETMLSIIDMAEGTSKLNKQVLREGLVFKCLEDPSLSFKAISNQWLLKYKE